MALAPDLRGLVLQERYELREPLGAGAFGRVYRAHDRRLHRDVAVKLLAPWWARDPAAVAVFRRETQLLARCSDPGVVQIHDVGEGPDGPYSVSELVDGEDLARRLRAGGVTVEQARAIALGLCDGLGAAHALGIVHRDVKPANVLLDRSGAVKIADFGVARAAGAGETESLAAGTPRYMAPEQAAGGAVGAPADVYAVGVVLYEMLAGAPPFRAGSAAALALAHGSQAPPELPLSVPADLRAVVARALAKAPAARYADGAVMARALRGEPGVAAGDGAPEGPTSTRLLARRGPRRTIDTGARRRSLALLGLAVAILCALAAGAWLLAHPGVTRRPPVRRTAVLRRVEVPLVVGETADLAAARLRGAGLHVVLVQVAAPGIRPGTVTDESPAPGQSAPVGSTVRLSVSEVPRWRTVTSFSSTASPVVHIIGERFRLLVSAAATTHCGFLGLFCRHSTVTVRRAGAGALRSFGLTSGTSAAIDAGPGDYAVDVTPASGSTSWTIRVQDDY